MDLAAARVAALEIIEVIVGAGDTFGEVFGGQGLGFAPMSEISRQPTVFHHAFGIIAMLRSRGLSELGGKIERIRQALPHVRKFGELAQQLRVLRQRPEFADLLMPERLREVIADPAALEAHARQLQEAAAVGPADGSQP